MESPRYSLVIPFHNEAGNAGPLLGAARAVLEAQPHPFEAVLIDDGSTDSTGAELQEIGRNDPRWRVLTLPRQTGQAEALRLGLESARGQILLTLDGDGQNDPLDFPALLAVIEEGRADLVCGWRQQRRDPWVRRAMSRMANAVRRRVLRDGIHDAGCQLRVFRREVCAALAPSPLLQALLPAMAVQAGFRVTELPVRHHARVRGTPHYGLRQLWWQPVCEMAALWWRHRCRRRP